ncbi:MAG: T9SS type A sorting domain-containing protein [Bacteroidales bacterium]|nr:T9SS type A sorting domain-containing protein [Bacteroidales bacterium]
MKTKSKLLIVQLFLLISFICTAQVEPFTRTYDIYPGWTGEYLVSIEKTFDDGYIVAYNQYESFDHRTSILKLDKYGDIEWHRVLDEDEFPEAIATSVCIDTDNNYYLAGYFQKSYFPTLWYDYNGFIAKYNSVGDFIWSKSYGSLPHHETDSSHGAEFIYDIIFYDNDKLIVAGSENYCPGREIHFWGMPWLFAIDIDGNLLWEWNDCTNNVHMLMFGNFFGVTKTDNGNIVAAGELARQRIVGNNAAPVDRLGFIGVFDANGELQKRRSWNFLKNVSIFYDVKSLWNNHVAIVAYTADTLVYEGDKKERISLIVFDEELTEKFQYNINIGGAGGKAKISVDNDTNIFIVGATIPSLLYSKSTDTNHMLLAKFNKNAELIWKKYVGADSCQFALSQMDVVADNDGGVSFSSLHANFNTNKTGSYFYKMNENGNGVFELSSFAYPDDDEYIIFNNNLPITINNDVEIFPNPAKGEFIIEIPNTLINSSFIMISITGQIVANKILTQTQETIKINELKNGIYIIKIQKDNIIVLKKIVVNK